MTAIPAPSPELIDDLVTGNRILFDQKVVDAFGHLSVRHNEDPTKYLMSRHLSPGLVTTDDIVTFDLDSNALVNPAKRYYSERFIHGEIYKARPDVIAVVHCHAPQLIPFGATRSALRPIYHMSAFLGGGVSHFEIREAAGMTDMLIRTPELGRALAQSLGDRPVVLMRGHGATVAGTSVKQAVFRSVYAAMNAKLQMEAMQLGDPIFLEKEEAANASASNDRSLDRAWAQWQRQVAGED